MTRCIRLFCLLALAVLVVAQAASAQITTTCQFNEAFQTLDYSISGGGSGLTYTVTPVVVTGPIVIGNIQEMTGPDDAASMSLDCNQANFYGRLQVDICQGTLCFASYEFDLKSDGSCHLSEYENVPSYSSWSVAGLLLFLFAIGAVMIRRRLAMSL